MLVSEPAVGTDQRQKYLLIVGKDNVVEYRQVKVGSLRDGMRVIESGLQPDDLVVVKGVQRARPRREGAADFWPRTTVAAAPAKTSGADDAKKTN